MFCNSPEASSILISFSLSVNSHYLFIKPILTAIYIFILKSTLDLIHDKPWRLYVNKHQ